MFCFWGVWVYASWSECSPSSWPEVWAPGGSGATLISRAELPIPQQEPRCSDNPHELSAYTDKAVLEEVLHNTNNDPLSEKDVPRVVSCRGRRRCRPAPPLRCASTAWWCWCGSWCNTGRPGGTCSAEDQSRSLSAFNIWTTQFLQQVLIVLPTSWK